MAFRSEPLSLSEDEHEELRQMSLSRTLPAGDVFRARLILMLAQGRSYAYIRQRLHTTAPTISCLAEAVSAKSYWWLNGGTAPWPAAKRDHRRSTGESSGGQSAQTERRFHTLVVPEVGGRTGH